MKTIITILTVLLLFISIQTNEEPVPHKPTNVKLIVTKFTPQSLINYLKYKNVKHKEIVYAQALIETGNFTSNIFKQNNNLFGMKYVGKYRYSRPTYAIGEQHNHALYLNWVESVQDYILWQNMHKKTPIKTQQQYLELLRRTYAEDSSYVSVIKYLLKKDTVKWI